MAGLPAVRVSAGHDLLSGALAACARERYSGRVLVVGTPGGVLHLRDGLVVAAESPGAPGPEALLLRSGRIDAGVWDAVLRESGGARPPWAMLVARGALGAAQLRVMCLMAMRDAVFAMTVGQVDGVGHDPGGEPSAPVEPGELPARLLQDAARKIRALAALPYPVVPWRERPRPAGGVAVLGVLRREIVRHADGRRTARDLAFLVGRGVYPVTVEIARMLADGVLAQDVAPAPIPVRAAAYELRPREAPDVGERTPDRRDGLPRRQPGAGAPGWKGFFRLRHGGPAQHSRQPRDT
ncbi:hypothetical protein SRB5_60060 [Streptomyces sp. RB5]|uniref:MarR family transcriptional regulator n=1 Tax=Streptomyces smaragdinus TaxID=2585196 RepID=A0A7K0CQQ1_9ACTN|nr:MarR family transcriptional regulator [Streptomyces smaragdinus]MQY15815.1 hypothetical protein [Streptomyces smaragdinus]